MGENVNDSPIQQFVFAFGHFDTGGLQTLVIRMASWLNRHGYRSLLIVDEIDQNMRREIERNSLIYVETWQDDTIGKTLKLCASHSAPIGLMTFEILDYLKLERILLKVGIGAQVHHLIYGLSQGAMSIGSKISGRKGTYIRALYGRVVRGCLAYNRMIFMDAECQEATREAYGFDQSLFHDCVFPLPMYIDETDPRHWDGAERRLILSVARADFPYKGYLIGLVSEFEKMIDQGDDLYLRIVSFGKDIDVLKEDIAERSAKCQERIDLVEGATQDEIRRYLRSTWLYVGMGTTVLDAAKEYVPSIVVYHDTMLGKGYGFFSDNPLTIGVRYSGGGTDISDFVERVARLPINDYERMADDTHRLFVKNYSIDSVMERMVLRFNSVEPTKPSDRDLTISGLLEIARRLRRRTLRLDK